MIESTVAKRRNVLKNRKVMVNSGSYKKRSYVVERVLKNGYLHLKDLVLLNSKKKTYYFKIHHSKVSPL